MFSAFHPYKDELITYKAYLQFVLENNFQKSNDAPSARCPVCKGRLKVRAGQKKMMDIFIILMIYVVQQKKVTEKLITVYLQKHKMNNCKYKTVSLPKKI